MAPTCDQLPTLKTKRMGLSRRPLPLAQQLLEGAGSGPSQVGEGWIPGMAKRGPASPLGLPLPPVAPQRDPLSPAGSRLTSLALVRAGPDPPPGDVNVENVPRSHAEAAVADLAVPGEEEEETMLLWDGGSSFSLPP